MVLIIDNYDSFTWNIYYYFRQLGCNVIVYRNDKISISDIYRKNPKYLVISPGPGKPENAGISMEIIKHFAGKIPILGICLGHQAIAKVFGAKITHAVNIMHGKISRIYHNKRGIFEKIKSPINMVRYHSLIVDSYTLPSCFEITAWTHTINEEYEIMAIKHKKTNLNGIQFHPESIMSESGHDMFRNFLSLNYLVG